jgi:hypothetical protein
MVCQMCEDLRCQRDKLLATAMQIPSEPSNPERDSAAARKRRRQLRARWNGLRLSVIQHESICPGASEMLRFS